MYCCHVHASLASEVRSRCTFSSKSWCASKQKYHHTLYICIVHTVLIPYIGAYQNSFIRFKFRRTSGIRLGNEPLECVWHDSYKRNRKPESRWRYFSSWIQGNVSLATLYYYSGVVVIIIVDLMSPSLSTIINTTVRITNLADFFQIKHYWKNVNLNNKRKHPKK